MYKLARTLWPGFFLALVLLAPLTSCYQQSEIKIGFLVKAPEETWFQKEWDFAEQASKDMGFRLIKLGVADGLSVLSAIDNLAAQNAQGFVICSPDVKLGSAIVARAAYFGMKVIAVDDQLLDSDGSILRTIPYIGISAREIGISAAAIAWTEFLARDWKLEDTAAIVITYNQLETARARMAGAISYLDAVGIPPESILDSPQKTTNVAGGHSAANFAITKNPQVKHWIVLGLNDETVLGGVQALETRGFTGKDVIGVGINGMTLAVTELSTKPDSGFFGSILLDAKKHGYDSTAMLYRWIRDGIEPEMDTRTSGQAITRENYMEVLTNHGLLDLIP